MERTYGTGTGLPDPVCLCLALRMASRAVSIAYDDALRPFGLKTTQFSLLAQVASLGPVESSRLAEALGLDKTTLPRNLRPLQRRGLIVIERGDDRRTRLVRLTPAGRQLLREAMTAWRSIQASFRKRLGGEFDRTLDRLSRVTAAARR